MSGIIHRQVPPSCRLNRGSNRKKSVVLQNGRLVGAQGFSDFYAFLGIQDDAREWIEDDVILVKCAGILRQWIQQPPEHRPGLPIGRMRVGGRYDIGVGLMNRRMDHKSRVIDGLVTNQNVTCVVHQLKIRDFDLTKVLRERIDPETIWEFGIPHGDMARKALIEAIPREDAKCCGEALLTMQPLFLKGGRGLALNE